MEKLTQLLRSTLLSMVLIAAAFAPLFADIIYFSDGQILSGKVASQNS